MKIKSVSSATMFISVSSCISAFVVIAFLPCADCNRICSRRVNALRWVRETYVLTYSESYNGYCFFGCTKYRTRSYQSVRTVPRMVVEFRKECCFGYYQTHNEYDIKCEPICKPSCKSGFCKLPGQCACYRGYQLVKHVCRPEPKKCHCDYGYRLQNGYCEPLCTEPCVNATCIAPDKCDCLDGYRRTENDLCLPHCSNGCAHGICVSPQNCSCNDGWFRKDNVCAPRCDIDCGGRGCVAPNVCECYLGYKMVENGTCIPHCSSGCQHGTCFSPENCTCNDGYRKNVKDEVCFPVCDFDCGVGGTCSDPNHCDCHLGYEKSENGSCIPLCHSGCIHGNCFSPNICTCNKGWKMNAENNTCLPVCDLDCGEGGTCTSPNVCGCQSGYMLKNATCIPYCSNGCIHGTCVGPENCSCKVGWHKHSEDGACHPLCGRSCGEGGTCIAPDICQCKPSYEMTVNRTCAPHCSKGCPNGICIKPGLCQCLEGWRKNELGDCEPHCDEPCSNGTCISPNVCQCFEGYKLHKVNVFDFLNKSLCIPKCKGCNGTCIAPDMCSCGVPFVPKYVSMIGGDCNCHTNCSADSTKCDHVVCVTKEIDWETSTDLTNDLSSKSYDSNIPYLENDAVTDELVESEGVAMGQNIDSVTKYMNNTEMNESSSLVNSTKSYWSQSWIYCVAFVSVYNSFRTGDF